MISRARKEPYMMIPGFLALINGWWHRFRFLITCKNVRIGKGLRVYGRMNIMGSGRVKIGRNCMVQGKLFSPVNFMTVSPDAFIEIKDNAAFSGTVIQCFKHVLIDEWCNIANAYIVDSQAHHISIDRRFHNNADVPTASVTIEKNVWVSVNVVITHGVTIGRNSVIGACSLVRSDIPPNSLYSGIPKSRLHENVLVEKKEKESANEK